MTSLHGRPASASGIIAIPRLANLDPERPRRYDHERVIACSIGGGFPRAAAIAITPDGKTAYVVSASARRTTVIPIATATNTPDVTTEPAQRYETRFQPAARRAIAQRLPEAVAAAVLEFCDATLAVNPQRVGKPLFGPLAGCHGALRGTYGIVYRIDENSRIVHVLDIDHRSAIYHRPHQ